MTDSDTLVANKGKAVTVVISRRVLPGHEKDYDEWVRKMVAAATEAPGNIGATLLIPETGKQGLHHLVLRFADRESVLKWETSYLRQKLSHEADAFSVSSRQEATGLETWFSIPECPELAPPPPWKMFLITSLAVYISSSIIIPIQGRLENWPFLLGNILSSILVVGSLTWGLMPWFSRYVFRRWLYRE
jgi:antibiotic biosynthesis monooxygenase (ABM) superfamily enzyme